MCNEEALEAVRQQVEKLVPHVDSLRQRFNEIEEDFREGNLEYESLRQLNVVVHDLESDSAAFESMMET